jgi:hypothetical protein
MKQIACGEQRETQDRAAQIEVMANAMFGSPTHPREQVKCFREMSKDNNRETSCAEGL